jgi:hypothetical protein
MFKYLFIIFLLLIVVPLAAHGKKRESYYQNKWCATIGGRTEVTLTDMSRCDCLTNTHAVEVDFANKWHEAIGQSLHYALQTGKKAGIMIILISDFDKLKVKKLKSVIERFRLPIDIWVIKGYQ